MPQRGALNISKAAAMSALARAIQHIAQTDGDYNTAIPSLTLHRRHAPTAPLHCIYTMGVGLAAQGRKQVWLGGESIDYGPGQSMLTTIDLPLVSHVTRASPHEPFLGMMLTLDARSIVQMASEIDAPPPGRPSPRSLWVEKLDEGLLDALVRLVELLDEPALVPRLAPLIQQEIIIRLLTGPHGRQLRLVTARTPNQRIAKAVAWLKQNFVQELQGDDLAGQAHMSPSSFRQHFRAITGLSPLQYQKQLRLQEARHLMLNQNVDASGAAQRVGYESASQFSREYSRMFGAPPQRNIKSLRAKQRTSTVGVSRN